MVPLQETAPVTTVTRLCPFKGRSGIGTGLTYPTNPTPPIESALSESERERERARARSREREREGAREREGERKRERERVYFFCATSRKVNPAILHGTLSPDLMNNTS